MKIHQEIKKLYSLGIEDQGHIVFSPYACPMHATKCLASLKILDYTTITMALFFD